MEIFKKVLSKLPNFTSDEPDVCTNKRPHFWTGLFLQKGVSEFLGMITRVKVDPGLWEHGYPRELIYGRCTKATSDPNGAFKHLYCDQIFSMYALNEMKADN